MEARPHTHDIGDKAAVKVAYKPIFSFYYKKVPGKPVKVPETHGALFDSTLAILGH